MERFCKDGKICLYQTGPHCLSGCAREASASPALLYACIVTDCWESWQESLHRTKAGAWKAGRKWLVEQFNSDYERRATIGKHTTDFMPGYQNFKVRPVEVKE